MKRIVCESFDVAVIGAGHAGCEAALAAARLGAKTAVFTLSLDTVANMPCNPSIGGTAKGHLVYEIDALGGEMARAADATCLQSRMLNMGKGPAVHSLRMQSDRVRYHEYMKSALEGQKNLSVIQAEIAEVAVANGRVEGVVSALGAFYPVRAAVIATGTYLGGLIHIGETHYSGGPDNVLSALKLTKSLAALRLPIRRFKTGTPARVHRRSIDFSLLERQDGDCPPVSFSMTGLPVRNTQPCYIAYTNPETHRVIRENLDRSPLYGGIIEGVGPRYCPSIEDKVVRFADRERHQIFVEPCGESTEEMYLQGLSSSLPLDVQIKMYRTIRGLENVEIMRPAYAIEYDCCDPTALSPSLEVKAIGGLFGAGQFNGSSGYEEAAAQGLVAGINAARLTQQKPPLVLSRAESYIGTLVDDLVTKGVSDPYRMMTARSEFRLWLRQDNADIRLCETGREIGLLSDEVYNIYLKNKSLLENELKRLHTARIPRSAALDALLEARDCPLSAGAVSPEALLRHPRISYDDLAPFDADAADVPSNIRSRVETELKYEGYLKRQQLAANRLKAQEGIVIPADIRYSEVTGLRLEAAEKLEKIRPLSLGQALRISGVNPADIAVLSIWLKKRGAYRD